jgi:hypothetical protein
LANDIEQRARAATHLGNDKSAEALPADTEASMHAIANLRDGYIPRQSEIIQLEFAVREQRKLSRPGASDIVGQMFNAAVSEKLARIDEIERNWKPEAA